MKAIQNLASIYAQLGQEAIDRNDFDKYEIYKEVRKDLDLLEHELFTGAEKLAIKNALTMLHRSGTSYDEEIKSIREKLC